MIAIMRYLARSLRGLARPAGGGALAMAAALALSACVDAGLLEAGTVVVTDKTTVDHAVSLLSGKDCSTVRLEAGRTYCVEDEVNPAAAQFCYRTLGDVTCYDRPNTYDDRVQRVGSDDPRR